MPAVITFMRSEFVRFQAYKHLITDSMVVLLVTSDDGRRNYVRSSKPCFMRSLVCFGESTQCR